MALHARTEGRKRILDAGVFAEVGGSAYALAHRAASPPAELLPALGEVWAVVSSPAAAACAATAHALPLSHPPTHGHCLTAG